MTKTDGPTTRLLWVYVLLVSSLATMTGAAECAVDNDCRPANCCHATSCLPTELAGICPSGQTSSQCSCEPFTLDCGGRCFCTELKKCAAILNLNTGGNAVSGTVGVSQGLGSNKKRKYTYGYTKVAVKK